MNDNLLCNITRRGKSCPRGTLLALSPTVVCDHEAVQLEAGAAGVRMVEGRWSLVAADDTEFQISVRRELAGLSERLLAVRSGRDCLRVIEDRRIGFVVLDSSLPDVPGTQLVHLVRQIRPDVGVVLTFAQSDRAQECEVRQAGVLFYGDRSAIRDIASVLRKGMEMPGADGKGGCGGCGGGSPATRSAEESGTARGL